VSAAWLGRAAPAAAIGPLKGPPFPALPNEAAWARLPRADPPLPAWARVLAASLPRTTAAMLQLDQLHRAKNPLGPVQAGKLRWEAADAIGCEYGKRCAEADLRRAGCSEQDLKRLAGDPADRSPAERAARAFARKVTRAAYTVTDAEVAGLLAHFGPETVVAMVHTLAYANFENRIFLALRIQAEPGGLPPPLAVQLDPNKAAPVPTPARPPWDEAVKARPTPATGSHPGWQEHGDLEQALEQQKNRKARIPLPPPERLAALPPEAKAEAARIVWTTVSAGYQPLLTKTWFDCMRTFQMEAQLDRVFSGSLFWVVTRSNECFY
jgi:alkylhydroperoxidase family enzyme